MSQITHETEDFLHTVSGGLSRSQARLFSNFTLRTAGRGTEPNWHIDEASARRLEAFRLASAALSAYDADRPELASHGFQRAAELLEWIAADFPNDTIIPILSAAFYQLSDLPAMARTIINVNKLESDLYAGFITSDFATFQAASNDAEQLFGFDPEQFQSQSVEDTLSRMFLSALNVIVAEMRWGDDRHADALSTLRTLASFFADSNDRESWLLAKAFSLVATRYLASSLRNSTRALNDTLSATGQDALERYVRSAFRAGRALAWPTQRAGLRRLAQSGSFALCTPTGSGKTTIAEAAIIQALYEKSNGWGDVGFARLAIYIVPSRALAAEVEYRLRQTFAAIAANYVRVITSYGGIDVGASDELLLSQSPTVIVCTQEKCDALIRLAGAFFVNRLTLLIVDEAHNVNFTGNDYTRSLRLESIVARLTGLRGTNTRMIALSAVVDETDHTLGDWCDAGDQGLLRVAYQSTRRVFGRLTISNTGNFTAEYDIVNGSLIGASDLTGDRPRVPGLVPRFTHGDALRLPNGRAAGPEVQMRAIALWAAAHLSDVDVSTSGSVLITVGSKIEYYAKSFLNFLETWEDLPRFHVEPVDLEARRVLSEALNACADYFGNHSFEYRLLKYGIVVHHGKLPPILQRRFTTLVDKRIARICLATSTLSQGVNLPFETVLLPSLSGHTGTDEYAIQEIRNVIGRAGRPGIAREGRALVLMGTTRVFYRHGQRYQRILQGLIGRVPELRSAAESSLNQLLVRLQDYWSATFEDVGTFGEWLERVSIAEIGSEPKTLLEDLDSFIIAAMEELSEIGSVDQSDSATIEEALRTIWRKTYAYVLQQSAFREHAIISRSRRLRRELPAGTRKRIYRAAMRESSVDEMVRLLPAIKEHLNSAFAFGVWDANTRAKFFIGLQTLLLAVPQFDFMSEARRGDPDWKSVIRWWLGVHNELVPAVQIGRWYSIASDLFGYRLPWAISSSVLILLPEDPFTEGDIEARMTAAGLPLILGWFRDMLAIGVPDPIAAYLVQAGLVHTRQSGMDAAQGYYNMYGRDDQVFGRENIDKWVAKTFPQTQRKLAEDAHIVTIPVDQQVGLSKPVVRVTPSVVGDVTSWRDISGYPVARTTSVGIEFEPWRDYEIDFDARHVSVSDY